MIPGSQALLLSIFPQSRRATALGIWSITTLVAPICGPILGGFISDNYHWGWIFLINVPVGLLVAFLCWSNLGSRETAMRRLPVDAIGMGLLVLWAGALQIMLDRGKNADWFASPLIIGLAIVSVVGFLLFLVWELTEKYPIVDLSMFRFANFTLGTLIFCLGNGVFLANMLLMSLWLQTQMGYTATWAGLVSAPTGAVAVILTPLVVMALAQIDARVVATHCLPCLRCFLSDARQPDGGCELWRHRHATDRAGDWVSDLLHRHGQHRAGWRAGRTTFLRRRGFPISLASWLAAFPSLLWRHYGTGAKRCTKVIWQKWVVVRHRRSTTL